MIDRLQKRKYAVLGMGEILLRLSPMGKDRISSSEIFEKNVGGAELNVVSGISMLGLPTAILSRIPKSEIGKYVRGKVLSHGVSDEYLLTDTSQDSRLGIYYYESGAYPRQPLVLYDRLCSSFSSFRSEEVTDGVYSSASVFHISGIAIALRPELCETVIRMIRRFKDSGAVISFDVNYRSTLWSEDDARDAVLRILPLTDLLFVSEETCRRMLNMKGTLSEIHEALAARYGNLGLIASTRREAVSPGRHNFSSMLYDCHARVHVEEREYRDIEVVDRIGSGDAYIAGALYAMIKHGDSKEMIRYGDAMAAIKSTIPGDITGCDLSDVLRVMDNHSAGRSGSEPVR